MLDPVFLNVYKTRFPNTRATLDEDSPAIKTCQERPKLPSFTFSTDKQSRIVTVYSEGGRVVRVSSETIVKPEVFGMRR